MFPVFEAIRFLFLIKIAQIFALVPIIAVMFTFSFSSAFAAETYTSADYQNTLWEQWTNYYSQKVSVAEQDYAKACAFSGESVLYGTGVKASDLGLKAHQNANWTQTAVSELTKAIRADIETAIGKFISETIESQFGTNSTYTETAPSTYDIGNVVVYKGVTLKNITAEYSTAVNADIAVLKELQANVIYDAAIAKITATSEAAYTAENANKIADLKAAAAKEINKVAAGSAADDAKAAAYVNKFKTFMDEVGKIPTIEDTDYADADTDAAIADAVADYVSYGLTRVYGELKLVADGAVPSHLMVAANDKIYEAKAGKSAVIFGVEVADVTKVTKAEATKVNNAMRAAIIDSAEVVAAYAAAIDVKTNAERVQAVRVLYKADWQNGSRTEFLTSLNKAIKAADVYADVVAAGDVMKDTYVYGIKVYNNENVDQAVKDAEKLVYVDLKVGFKDAEKYIEAAAEKGGYSLYEENFEYEAFLKAIDAAQAKFYKDVEQKTPQTKVLYGDDKTAEEDYVYLKATYATVEAGAWTDIADDAVAALEIAESYADIDAALAAAAADMSELMKAEDEVAVTAAITRHVNALADAKAEAIKIMGTKNYSDKAFEDAYKNGKAEIEKADTLAEVDAAYTEAVNMLRSIPTKDELAAAEKALIEQIKALPTTSALTAADKDTVLKVLDAYLDYVDMPGNETYKIYNTHTFNTDLDAVLRLVGKDIQTRVDAMAKSINKCNPVTDNGAAALIALEDDIRALLDEVYDFNDILDDVAEVASLNVFDAASLKITRNVATLEGTLDAENDIWASQLHVVFAEANKANTSAEKAAVLEAYGKLTDRQKYKAEQNLKTLIAEFKAEITASVEALKIKANSTAKKGAITVKWTVKGDKAAVDGYQVYKSTKAQKGYKKAITTKKTSFKNTKNLKKGVRYFYKVRAYKVVDGKTYYSDWSNKANRYAK